MIYDHVDCCCTSYQILIDILMISEIFIQDYKVTGTVMSMGILVSQYFSIKTNKLFHFKVNAIDVCLNL